MSLIVKDFLWWLLKENLFVNWFYRNVAASFFADKPVSLPIIKDNQLTSKEQIRQGTYIPKSEGLLKIKGYTSGTTNAPLEVLRSPWSIFLEEYMVKSYLADCGVPLRPKIAILRGDLIVPSETKNPPFWKMLPFTRRLVMSSFHLSPQNAQDYFAKLDEYQPDIIMAYPSSAALLAKLAKQIDWKPHWEIKGVFTSSESFSEANQELVRSVFGSVFDHYGQAERVAALQQCSEKHYHVRTEYSFVEFVKDEQGIKIVGTNWHNKAMSLVRYDTGDYVEGLNEKGGCPCGKATPYVNKILGRDDDYVILPDGKQIGRLDVAFKGIDGLAECQLIQTSVTNLDVDYVASVDVDSTALELKIEESLRKYLGHEIAMVLTQKRALPRTKAGKFQSVVRKFGSPDG